MRHRAAVLVACAVFGLHCGAPTDDSGAEIWAEVDIPKPLPVREHQAPLPPDVIGPSDRRRTVGATSCNGCTFTSSVVAGDGSTYTAGTFFDTVQFGSFLLASRGMADIFLVKASSDGTVVWAIAVGSTSAESAARVTVKSDGSSVTLMGLTQGPVDCGAGPLPQWDENTFFLCRYQQSDGLQIDGGSFPSGH